MAREEERWGRMRASALIVAAFALGITAPPASAATFTASCTGTTGDPTSLVAAIDSANANPGPDTVALGPGCVYTLTAVNNAWYGPNGLPPIASPITIDGHGATIARSSAAPPFRLFFVGADPTDLGTEQYVSPGAGALTLRQVTLTGGLARGGDSNGGGGGAGMGGAILTQGSVAIDASTLTGNTAQGGAATNNVVGLGGGGIGTDSPADGSGGGFGTGAFGGGAGGAGNSGGAGGGAGFGATEGGQPADMFGNPGAGGGLRTGLGGAGGTATGSGAAGGNGGGGGGRGTGDPGGAFGEGGIRGGGGGGGGGGVGGGGAAFATAGDGGGGGGFGGGGGTGGAGATGGSGGFGGGGGYGPAGGGSPGFGGGTATATAGGGGGAGLGGAIFNMQGRVLIIASTVAGNAASAGADNVPDHAKGLGGGVFNLNGTVFASGTTFAGNTAAYDGASIYNLVDDGAVARAATLTLVGTIVANGVGPFDLASSKPADAGGVPNLGSATADVSTFDLVRAMRAVGTGGVVGAPLAGDPLLGPLAQNGGPTATLLPASGSPVIDAVPSGSCLSADQRGFARPDPGESRCDIGAVEVQDPPGGGGRVPIIRIIGLRPASFPAAPSGPSAAARRRRYGTTVTYTLNEPASVVLTVTQSQTGRRGPGGRCVAPTRRNRAGWRCTRRVTLRGSITTSGRSGTNRLSFAGRLRGHRLSPGSYQLLATPASAGQRGPTATAGFRIVQ